MAVIDIRNGSVGDTSAVSVIYFADSSDYNVSYLEYSGDGFVSIDTDTDYLNIASKEDAQNLIKALEKAIELGWWN